MLDIDTPTVDPLTITVDGERFTMDNLTFRERREVRRIARELDGNMDLDFDDVMIDDLLASFITVCKRRTVPTFTIDDALDLTPGDVVVNAPAVEADSAPPTAAVVPAVATRKRSKPKTP